MHDASNPLRYHGGKSYLTKHLLELAAQVPHTRYCETHFGGGAMLFAKPCEGVAEFVNDINHNLAHFWHVLARPELFSEFQRRAVFQPLSEPDFDAARERLRGWRQQGAIFPRLPLEAALDFFTVFRQSRQGIGKNYCTPTRRLRRGMNEQVAAWLSAVEGLPEAHERLKRVEIFCMDGAKFIRKMDLPEALFYCDPTYPRGTRSVPDAYMHEMTDEQHGELLGTLAGIRGKFILSGYPNELYDSIARSEKWRILDICIDNKSSGAKVKEKKTERLWVNF